MDDAAGPPDDAFLDAANGRPGTHTPVWFMRQAGRSLPEYRGVRGEGSILDAIKQPEVAAEITMQPVRRYGVDAAVLYSDIVVAPHAVGFGVDVAPGTGPVAERPLRSRTDLERLRPLEVDDITYVTDTVDLLVAELEVPLLAFAGAPFTVASYLIEGRPSKDYRHTKALIHTDEALWHDVMERLAESAITFIDAQLSHGARAFQLFDSWAGSLSRRDYECYVLPHSRHVFRELRRRHPDAPAIHFGIGCDHLLESMLDAGPTVMGLDWRTPIDDARRRLGDDLIVQGNLDPALVLAGTDAAVSGARQVLSDNELADGRQHPGHIFNLGHGVQPDTDPGVLAGRCRPRPRTHRQYHLRRQPLPRRKYLDMSNADHTTTNATATGASVAVVLMAYGTPRTPEEIEPYYTDIRRGRPPTPEALADLVARYGAIGGVSPLAQLTEAQRDALQAALDATDPGKFHVTLGLKHAEPKVEVAARAAAETGVSSVVGLVLAPHYSSYSIGQYLDRTRLGVDESGAGIPVVGIDSWATEPAFVEFLADDLSARVAAMRERTGGPVRVLFTAHSLPQRIIDAGDPYPEQLRSTAEAVAARVGLAEGDDWQIAWQSAGRTPEPWIGPDILAVIDELGAQRAAGADDAVAGVIVSACGFVADHLEVLFDLDIEAADRAASLGLAFDRTACVNDDPAVMAALAERVRTIAP